MDKIYGNVVGAPTPPIDSYTKAETNKLLANKVSKEDIVSAYKFCGSVDKFDDLPHRYALIPNGVPTLNGVACGTYDEETHTVSIDLHDCDFEGLIIPIVPINIRGGKYFTRSIYYDNALIGELDTYACGAGGNTYVNLNDCIIDHISLLNIYGEGGVSGTTDHLGYLNKITDSWLPEDSNEPYFPSGAYDNGNVYNVLDGGMNYAWTGTDWDALGGEHKDLEAREQIEALTTTLQEQTSDIETALDSIIEIQNGLIGGDA